MDGNNSDHRHTLSRRTLLGQLGAVSALLSSPRMLWSSMHRQRLYAVLQAAAAALPWTRKQSPLMTRWSSLVTPEAPHPEYPRPQFVRKDWLNLNGVWQYRPGTAADEPAPFGSTLSGSILVPYPVESALSGVMEHHERLWYRRQLTIPAAWRNRQVLLHFGAVDYEAEIFVNGDRVGQHSGGYDEFSFNITPFLHGKEQHELIVRVFDPTESGGQPRGKQNTRPRGITYTPTTGIWQTVWLEPVSPTHMEGIRMVPDIDRGVLHLTVDAAGGTVDAAGGDSAHAVEVVVRAEQATVAKLTLPLNKETEIPIANARLWSPDDPFLYTIELKLKHGHRELDSITSYFGMRKTHVGDADGHKKLLLNNRFVFQLGPLDQGFWPDGIYTSPTDDALKNDILQLKAMGFNMVRKHIKVEPARWYYWADTLGLLVWQDMPSPNSYPGKAFVPPPVDKHAFETGLSQLVKTRRNAPCIVLWIVFNEGQGQFDTERMVNVVKALDTSRPVNEASGGQILGFGDINDIHSYPEPAVREPNGRQALVCGEFGGIGYLIADHSWQREGHGYIEVETPTDLLYLYAEYIAQVQHLRDTQNLSAAVYTELTDVMTEVNGMLTYDRVPKISVANIRQVNLFQFPAPTYQAVLPTSQSQAQMWRYVTTPPDGPWSSKDFDDAHWLQGPAPFSNDDRRPGTRWTTPDIWLRLHFNPGSLTPGQIQNLVLTEAHRGHLEVSINGVPTYAQQGNNRATDARYQNRPLSQALRRAILPNADNVLAIHIRDAQDQQSFDAGLSVRIGAVSLP